MTDFLPVKKNRKVLLFEKMGPSHFLIIDLDLKIIHFDYSPEKNTLTHLKSNDIPMLAMIPRNPSMKLNLIENQGIKFLSINHMIFSFNKKKMSFSLFKILKENVIQMETHGNNLVVLGNKNLLNIQVEIKKEKAVAVIKEKESVEEVRSMVKIGESLFFLNKDSTITVFSLKIWKIQTDIEVFDQQQKPFPISKLIAIQNQLLGAVCGDYLFIFDKAKYNVV